jgi:hypothetical protein
MKECKSCGIYKSDADVLKYADGRQFFKSCGHPISVPKPWRQENITITDDQKRMIKHLRKRRWSYLKIAESMKLPQSSVGSVIRGENGK